MIKKVLKSLVIIWVYTLSLPACADDLFAPVSSIEKMYLERNKKSSNLDNIRRTNDTPYHQSNTSADCAYTTTQPNKQNYDASADCASATTQPNEQNYDAPSSAKQTDLPRLKRVYIGVYAGYFYTKDDNFQFKDKKNCTSPLTADFLCNDGISNPINLDYKDDYFLSATFGINSENPLRLELSYFALGKAIDINGTNKIGLSDRNYKSTLDLKGGSANIYFDLVGNRRKPYFIFVPYAMAGIGISEIDLGNLSFQGSTGNTYTVSGKIQRNKTIIYGAGFSIGLNNYISMDLGYRHYDFGTIETDNILTETRLDTSTPETPVSVDTQYNLQMETKLKAHIAILGIKLQI